MKSKVDILKMMEFIFILDNCIYNFDEQNILSLQQFIKKNLKSNKTNGAG